MINSIFSWDKFTFFRVVFPFVLGILVVNFCQSLIIFWVLLLSSLFFLLFDLFLGHRMVKLSQRAYSGLLIVLSFFCLGAIYGDSTNEFLDANHFGNYKIEDSKYLVRLEEPLINKKKSCKAEVKVLEIHTDATVRKIEGSAIIYFSIEEGVPDLEYGDLLLVEANFKEIDPPKNPNQFDYKTFLSNQRIYHQAYLKPNQWQKYGVNEASIFYQWIFSTRDYFLAVIKKHVESEKEVAVACALLLGYKHYIDSDLRDVYANTGAMHVLAVSGLHVGIIWMLLNLVLKVFDRFKFLKFPKLILIILGVWLFAFLTGLSPSVWRASLMFTLIQVGAFRLKSINSFNIIFASAFILLCYDPLLIYQVGFQLSYLAVAGIIFIQPKLDKLLVFDFYLTNKVWQLTTVSIAAQIATFPLSLYYFNQFPIYFFVSNLIVIPAASVVLSMGMLLFVVSFSSFWANCVGFILQKLISILNFLLERLESLPISTIEGIYIEGMGVFVLYGAILLFIHRIFKQEHSRFRTVQTLVTTLIMYFIFVGFTQRSNQKMIVYHLKNETVIDFFQGRTATTLISNAEAKGFEFNVAPNRVRSYINDCVNLKIDSLNEHYQSKNLLINFPFVQFGETKTLIIDDQIKLEKLPNLEVDVVILRNNFEGSIELLKERFNPKKIVLDNTIHYRNKKNLLAAINKLDIDCHDIWRDGAFILEL